MSEGSGKTISPLPALPQVVHEAVRREIAQMNTAICQATLNSPIKVSLTWRANPRFAERLSQQVLDCVDNDTPAATPKVADFSSETANVDRSIAHLEKYVAETIQRLERVLAAFKAAAADM